MLLKFQDYERIFKVVNSIIKNEGLDPSKNCIFFSLYGASILSKHYNFEAVLKAGLAAYHIGEDEAVLFGREHQGNFYIDDEKFHCWVEVDGWVIDFMAPAFSPPDGGEKSIPSKMLQKPLTEMASSLIELRKAGDFYLEPTEEFTQNVLERISAKWEYYNGLAELCVQWFKKYPQEMSKTFTVAGETGNQNIVSLAGNSIVGVW